MEPITVTFPLIGVWQVVISPGDHVPSHYTDALGMTYAFDFAKPADIDIPLLSRLNGVDIVSCEVWNEEVVSPISGQVVEVQGNISDRKKLYFIVDALSSIYSLFFSKGAKHLEKIFGNYVIIKNESCWSYVRIWCMRHFPQAASV